MNYKDEIIKMVNTVTQDTLLKFVYSLLRMVTSDPERYSTLIEFIEKAFN